MPTFNLTNGNDTFPGGQPGWVNTGEDIVNGFDGEDLIDGGVLNDALSGMNGNDTILGGSGDDVIQGGENDDDLSGGTENDSIAGEAGADIIHGDDGNDTLKGGAGNDEIYGDAGNDTFDVAGDTVGANDIDMLYGGEGDDKIVTGLIVGTAATISFDGGNGTDTVGAFGSLIGYTFTNVETLDNLYLIRATTSQLNQFATVEDHYAFDDFTNIFVEDAGIVDFRGRLGAGVIKLNVQTMGYANTIHSGDGDDNIQVNFVATGTDGVVFFGDGGNDDLRGGVGNDILVGGAGNDYLDGGGGTFNLVSYEDAAAAVTVSLNIPIAQDTGGAGIDTIGISTIAGIIGSAFGDVLTSQSGLFDTGKTLRGEAGNDMLNGGIWHDTLEGGGDNDVIAGGAGVDTINGGSGIDTASYAGAAGAVTVSLLIAGQQNVGGGEGLDTLVQIENLIGSSGNDTLTGNGSANVIDGGLGNDAMAGGGGNDTYGVDSASDSVTELLGQGYDTINTTLLAYTLGANLERVNFVGNGNFVGTGNNLANRFQGGVGDDRFVDISGGADIFSGNAGTDTVDFRTSATGATINFTTNVHGAAAAGDSYSGIEKFLGSNTAKDTMTGGGTGRFVFAGGGGNDVLTGGVKNDQLLGQAGQDTLRGGADRDTLDGGTGNDTLTGGSEADVFVFIDAAFGQDTITDYQDGLDSFKVFSAVADNIADFTIANNGTTTVTLTLIGSPTNTITINGAAPITISGADFVFY